jgi:hypothetical protein
MTRIAAAMPADLAAPDGHKRPGGAVGAAPGEDVAVGGLDDGEGVAGALVCHVVSGLVCLVPC